MNQKCVTNGNLTFFKKQVFCETYSSFVNLLDTYATNFTKISPNIEMHKNVAYSKIPFLKMSFDTQPSKRKKEGESTILGSTI